MRRLMDQLTYAQPMTTALFTAMLLCGCAASRSSMQPLAGPSDEPSAALAERLPPPMEKPDAEKAVQPVAFEQNAQPQPQPQPVEYFVQLGLQLNPEITAARHAVSAATFVGPQVTSLPDPLLTDTFQPIDDHSLQTAAGRSPNTLSLSQKLPWLDKLRVQGDIADRETQIALTRLAQTEIRIVESIKLAYYELAFLQRAIQIVENDQQLLNQLLQFAEARYRTNSTSQQDVLRAQIELNRLQDKLITLQKQKKVAQADLAEAIHLSESAALTARTDLTVPELSLQIETLFQMAVQQRPELQEQMQSIMRNRQKEQLAELQYYPDFNVGISWQAITGAEAVSPVANGNDNLGFMLGMTLPVWQDRLSAGVREARHQTAAAARRYDATRDDTLRMIRRLVAQAESQRQQIDLFQDSIIPKAEQALRVSTADYRVNKLDFQQILDNWSDVLMFHLQVARLQASLNQTLASLERVVGQQLTTPPTADLSVPRLPPAEISPDGEKRPAGE